MGAPSGRSGVQVVPKALHSVGTFSPRRTSALMHSGGSLVNVLDTRMIAPKKYVAVLKIANEFVVVGITDQHINLLIVERDAVADGAEQARWKATTVDQNLRTARCLHQHCVAVAHIE